MLDEAEAAQRRRAEATREAAARGDRAAVVRLQDPDHLPGGEPACGHLSPHWMYGCMFQNVVVSP